MRFIETQIPDLYIIQPSVYEDERGYFLEAFNLKIFKKKIGNVSFVQDNESKSSIGVLRGLHFQNPPFDQAKLVRCIKGRIMDVSVDLRKGSPTYGKHFAIELSGKNKTQLFIPRGFAHGFLVLSDSAVCSYKVDNFYAPDYDSGIRFIDKELCIDWGLKLTDLKLSKKDKNLLFLKDLDSPFKFKNR